jgi:hypothetical protein
MEVLPFVFYHSFEPIDLCFEGSYDGFLSDFVENVGDRTFSALPVRNIIFDEFSFDITKEEEITWCEVRAVSRVRYPLGFYCVKTFNGSPWFVRTCIVQVYVSTVE